MPAADFGKMICQLSFADAGDAAPFVDSTLGVLQRVPAHVGCKDFHVPGIRERERVRDRDADGIRFFSRSAAGAPNPYCPGMLPKRLRVNLGQYSVLTA